MKLTIVNLDDRHKSLIELAGHAFIAADGRQLPFSDKEFDLVFSNSVIEHVGDRDSQMRFANEMLRVGKSIYCQTPNRWFPIEPHLIAPFLHWLPFAMARRLVRYGSIWGLVTRPSQEQIDDLLSSIRLLSLREVRRLFGGCTIRSERIFGLAKSFIVERRVVPIEKP
jgi:ubiquinone/menaquinone biosynthesis C-methylase UbiE